MQNLDLDTKISLLSMLIAALSALYAKHQATLAKKQYQLELETFNHSIPNVRISSSETGIISIDTASKYVFFCIPISIHNASSSSTSIVEYTLTLHCTNGLKYKPEICPKSISDKFKNINILNQCHNIDGYSSITGWCIFQLSQENYTKLEVSMFTITVTDINSCIASKNIMYLKEELINYEI